MSEGANLGRHALRPAFGPSLEPIHLPNARNPQLPLYARE